MTLPTVENQSAKEGQAFSQALSEATGDVSPHTYTVTGLSADLTFEASTRTISGTPTAAGDQPVTYTVTDSTSGCVDQTFTIAVAAPSCSDTGLSSELRGAAGRKGRAEGHGDAELEYEYCRHELGRGDAGRHSSPRHGAGPARAQPDGEHPVRSGRPDSPSDPPTLRQPPDRLATIAVGQPDQLADPGARQQPADGEDTDATGRPDRVANPASGLQPVERLDTDRTDQPEQPGYLVGLR